MPLPWHVTAALHCDTPHSHRRPACLPFGHALQEAKQRVPHFLLALDDPLEEMEKLAEASGVKGCAICGGLGHRATQCPKLEAENKAAVRNNKDYFGSGGFGGEM